MTKEDQYKIAMIALASLAGVLLIAVIIICCCCMRYQRQVLASGTGSHYTKKPRNDYEQSQWPAPVANYEAYAASHAADQQFYGASGNYGGHQGYESAYDWAHPTSPSKNNGLILASAAGRSNPYTPAPMPAPLQPKGNEYGRVLLNPPSAVCTKPAMSSTQLNGHCGSGGGCDGKFVSMSTGQPVASSGAQFVLQSGSSMQH